VGTFEKRKKKMVSTIFKSIKTVETVLEVPNLLFAHGSNRGLNN